MSIMQTLPVVEYFIADSDEGIHKSDNPQDFDEACKLLARLREQNPDATHTLCAEVDA